MAVAILALLACLVPLGHGGLLPVAQLALLVGGALALLLAPRRHDATVGPAAVAMIVLALGAGLQLLPLPERVLQALSPATADHFRTFLQPLGLYPAARPASLDPGATAAELARAVGLALVALAVTVAAHEPVWRSRLLRGVALGGVLVALVTLVASAGGSASYLEPKVVFANPNHLAALANLGAFTALGLAIRSRGSGRLLWLGGFLVCGLVSALSLSRGGITAFVLAALSFAWLQARTLAADGRRPPQRRLLLGALLGVAVAAGTLAAGPLLEQAATLRTVGQESRLSLWPVALRLLRDHPLLGIGRGAFATAFAAYKVEADPYTYTHAESELLQLPIDLGLPLGVLVLALLAWALVRALRRTDLSRAEVGALAGVLAVALQNAVDFSLELPGVSLPAVIALCAVSPPFARRAPSLLLRGIAVVGLGAGVAGFLAGQRLPADAVVAHVDEAGPVAGPRAALPYVARHPADYLPHAAVGAVLARAERCAEAFPWLTRAMLLNPTAAAPHRYGARCHALSGNGRLAQREFRLAASLGDPGALREAAQWFPVLQDLLGATPDTPTARRELATALLGDRPADAARILEELLGDYGDEGALAMLARARLGARDPEGALAAAQEHLRVDPTDAPTTAVAFQALRQLGREDEAWSLLEEANRRTPGRLELVEPLVHRWLQRRRFSEARRLVESIPPQRTFEMLAREALLAHVLLAQGRDAEAAAVLERAAGAAENRAVLELLATVLEKLGRPAEAIVALQRAGAVPGTLPGTYDARIAAIRARAAQEAVEMDSATP